MRNRFKGLDLIDRVPDELWMEVRDIVQQTGIETIPMEKKCKKAKCLSGEALQIAVQRREAKSKGEKERYKHLNAEFQRIARKLLSRIQLFVTPWAIQSWNSPCQNTGVGSLSLLQQIFTTQESNPGLPHCKGTALMSPALASGFFTTSANW